MTRRKETKMKIVGMKNNEIVFTWDQVGALATRDAMIAKFREIKKDPATVFANLMHKAPGGAWVTEEAYVKS